MRIKVGTLCSGYDSQCMALDRLKENFPDFDYELMFWSEIDKYAIQAHNAVYPQWADRNLGDMTKIDWSKVDKVDLLTYSTPCTDISNAGQQKGLKKGSGTRSSILWYTEEAIRILRPKYLLMENVSALVSQKFLPYFHEWQNVVASYGYTNFTEVLNAKDYGVPQNRERVFMISILGGGSYYFPKPFKLKKRLKDVLETNVDEKYYLSDKMIKCFENSTAIAKEKGNGFRFNPTDGEGYAKAITTCAGNRTDDNFIIDKQATTKDDTHGSAPHLTKTLVSEPKIFDDTYGFETEPRIYNTISPTLRSERSGLKLIEPTEYTATTICLNSKVDGKQPSLEHRIYHCSGISTAITTGWHPSVAEPIIFDDYNQRIPKDQDCIGTLTTNIGNSSPRNGIKIIEPKVEQVGNIYPDTENFKNRTMGRVYSDEGLSPTINCCGGGDREPKVVEYIQPPKYRIRKLTCREVFRLMDVDDTDIDKIQAAGISNSQQYKLAGNSIVVANLYHLFRKMFVETENEQEQLTLF